MVAAPLRGDPLGKRAHPAFQWRRQRFLCVSAAVAVSLHSGGSSGSVRPQRQRVRCGAGFLSAGSCSPVAAAAAATLPRCRNKWLGIHGTVVSIGGPSCQLSEAASCDGCWGIQKPVALLSTCVFLEYHFFVCISHHYLWLLSFFCSALYELVLLLYMSQSWLP